MPRAKTKSYRLPPSTGHYRKGIFYRGGEVITIPASEKPGKHWTPVRVNEPKPVYEDLPKDLGGDDAGAGNDGAPPPRTMSEAQRAKAQKPTGA